MGDTNVDDSARAALAVGRVNHHRAVARRRALPHADDAHAGSVSGGIEADAIV